MPWEDWLQYAQEHWPQIATYVLFFLATLIPSIRLLHRTGIHLGWAAFNLIPFGGTIAVLWVVAFSEWPKLIRSPSWPYE